MNIEDYNKLLENTICEGNIKINQRELIYKILSRYTTNYTVFRELIQNSDDANSSIIDINIFKDKIIFSNNGFKIREIDWERIKTIAYGNTDENTIGCFGVGFYSVFCLTDEPIIISDYKCIKFIFENNELKIKSLEIEKNDKTIFIFQKLKTQEYQNIDNFIIFLKDIIKCTKNISIINILKEDNVIHSINKKKEEIKNIDIYNNYDLFDKNIENDINYIKIFKSTIESDNYKNIYNILECGVNLNYSDNYSKLFNINFSKKLPKKTIISLIFENSHQYNENFCKEQKFINGHIYIGFKTFQTTGYGFSINAQFIPTIERESLDMNTNSLFIWNSNLLKLSGKFARIYYDTILDCNYLNYNILPTFSYNISTPNNKIGDLLTESILNTNNENLFKLYTNNGYCDLNDLLLIDNRLITRNNYLINLNNTNNTNNNKINIVCDNLFNIKGRTAFTDILVKYNILKYISVNNLVSIILSSFIQDYDDINKLLYWLVEIKEKHIDLEIDVKKIFDSINYNNNIFSNYQYYDNLCNITQFFNNKSIIPKKLLNNFNENEINKYFKINQITFMKWFILFLNNRNSIVINEYYKIIEFIQSQFYKLCNSDKNIIKKNIVKLKCIPCKNINNDKIILNYPQNIFIDKCIYLPYSYYINLLNHNIEKSFLKDIGLIYKPNINDIINYVDKDIKKILEIIFMYYDNLDNNDIKNLQKYAIYNTQNGYKKPNYIYFYDSDLEKMNFNILRWEGDLDINSREYSILKRIGIMVNPRFELLIEKNEEFNEFMINYFNNNINIYLDNLQSIDNYNIIPTDQGLKNITNCFLNNSPFNFPTVLDEYKDFSKKIGVLKYVKLELIIEILINKSYLNEDYFIYLNNNLEEFNDNHINLLTTSLLLPNDYGELLNISKLYLKSDENINIYGNILDYISYSNKTYNFFIKCNVKSEPDINELCYNLSINYERYFKYNDINDGNIVDYRLNKYKNILRLLYDNFDNIDIENIEIIKELPIWLSYKYINNSKIIKLLKISDIYLINSIYYAKCFKPNSCPYIDYIESLYELLGCIWISDYVKEECNLCGKIYYNEITIKLKENINNKIPLIINSKYGKFRKNIKNNSEEILKKISINCCENIERTLCFDENIIKDTNIHSFFKDNTIYIIDSKEIDYFDIGETISKIISNKFITEDNYIFSMILSNSIENLKKKGFPVDKLYNSIYYKQSELETQEPVVEIEELVLPTKANIVEIEESVLQKEEPVVEIEELVLPTQVNIVEIEESVLQKEEPVVEIEKLVLPTQANIVKIEESVVEIEELVLPTKANIVEIEESVVEIEELVLPTQANIVEIEESFLQKEESVIEEEQIVEIKESVLQTEELIIEVEEPVVEIKGHALRKEELVVETEQLLLSSKDNVVETIKNVDNIIKNEKNIAQIEEPVIKIEKNIEKQFRKTNNFENINNNDIQNIFKNISDIKNRAINKLNTSSDTFINNSIVCKEHENDCTFCKEININSMKKIELINIECNIYIEEECCEIEYINNINNLYVIIEYLCKKVFDIKTEKINIFYSKNKDIIGFNKNNSIFLNSLFQDLSDKPQINMKIFWYIVIVHELSHNLEKYHNNKFNKVFENILISTMSKIIN